MHTIYRNPSISKISEFQKLAALREFCAKRDQKRLIIQGMRENSKIFNGLLLPFLHPGMKLIKIVFRYINIKYFVIK